MNTYYNAILEIEAHANGGKKDFERYMKTVTDLRQSTINNHNIVSVVGAYRDKGEPTRVKHFGYNYRCENGCEHELSAYGILRYFGIDLVIDCEPDNTLFGTYKVNAYSEIDICGMEIPYNSERKSLTKVERG